MALLTVIPLLLIATVLETYFRGNGKRNRNSLTRGQLIVRPAGCQQRLRHFPTTGVFWLRPAAAVARSRRQGGNGVNMAGESGWWWPAMRTGLAPLRRSCRTAAAGSGRRARFASWRSRRSPRRFCSTTAKRRPQVGRIAASNESTRGKNVYLLGRVVSYTATLLLIALVVIYRFSRHLTEPIRALSRAVAAIGAGQLSPDTRIDAVSDVHETTGRWAASITWRSNCSRSAPCCSSIDEATQQLRELAFPRPTDRCPTGVCCVRTLHAMAASRRSGRHCALMFIDLDNFKPLNDLHGHDVGDMLLVQAANDLKSCLCAAWIPPPGSGGDEFVVLLCDLEPAAGRCHRTGAAGGGKICSVLSEPCCLLIRQESDEPATPSTSAPPASASRCSSTATPARTRVL